MHLGNYPLFTTYSFFLFQAGSVDSTSLLRRTSWSIKNKGVLRRPPIHLNAEPLNAPRELCQLSRRRTTTLSATQNTKAPTKSSHRHTVALLPETPTLADLQLALI